METPPAASTCTTRAGSDSSVDSTCISILGKRPADDAKTDSPPYLKKTVDDERRAAQRRSLAPESETHEFPHNVDDANTRRVLRTMMAQENEQHCAHRRVSSAALIGDRHQFGASIIFMVLRAYQIELSSRAFGLAMNLLHRALALPKFHDQVALDPALPLACCSLGIKWECAAPANTKDLCRLAEKMGIALEDQALVQMELSLVEALNWRIDAVTPSHLLANIQLLSNPPLPFSEVGTFASAIDFFLKIYYTYVAPHAVHLPSTVVRAILSAVAGNPPPPPPVAVEPSDHADYRRILAILLQHAKGRCTSPLSASRAMPASDEQALRHEWLGWLPEGLAPLGRAQPL